MAEKVKAGLPPSKSEAGELNAYLSAVRQVSLSTRAHAPNEAPQEPKIDTAFGHMRAALKSNPRAKGVVYSNYLQAGIAPYEERLRKSDIPFARFTGDMPKKERDRLVRDYNEGKKRVMLLSSAGGEGLDLKGTRLVQVMEPHWNAEKLKQVEGRAIRMGSHQHLPKEEQKVRIENYLATRPPSGVLEKWRATKPGKSADEFLSGHSAQKELLLGQFRDLLG